MRREKKQKNIHVEPAQRVTPASDPVLAAINAEVAAVLRKHLPYGTTVAVGDLDCAHLAWRWHGEDAVFRRLVCSGYRQDENRECALEPGHSGRCYSAAFREEFVANRTLDAREVERASDAQKEV
jgi:hypothetical protein